MSTKYSEDIVLLTAMKVTPGRIVKELAGGHRPVLLTSRGRRIAVMRSPEDFKKGEEERAFMRALVKGFSDLDGGLEVSLAEALSRLGLK